MKPLIAAALLIIILTVLCPALYAQGVSVNITYPDDGAVAPEGSIQMTADATGSCLTFDWTDADGDWGAGNVFGTESNLSYNAEGNVYGTEEVITCTVTDNNGNSEFETINLIVPRLVGGSSLSYYDGITYAPSGTGKGETLLKLTIQPLPSDSGTTYSAENGAGAVSETMDPDGNHLDVTSTAQSSAPGDQDVQLSAPDGSEAADQTVTVYYPTSAAAVNVSYTPLLDGTVHAWETDYTMNVSDQFGGNMQDSTPIYESFGFPTPGLNNWWTSQLASDDAIWYLASGDGTFVDNYATGAGDIPAPVWQTEAGASTPMFNVAQYYAAAATASSGGVLVNSHTLTFFEGNAAQSSP